MGGHEVLPLDKEILADDICLEFSSIWCSLWQIYHTSAEDHTAMSTQSAQIGLDG